MSKHLTAVLGATLIVFSLAVVAVSQVQTTTVTKVQTPEGTYTIVEYPVGKETVVTLNPIGLTGATGRATILRDPSGTTIKLNLNSLPADLTALNVYAVDPTGALTLLGPVQVSSGNVAPMLGIPTFKKGDDTKLKIDFSGAMEGSRANIFIEPHKNGKLTEVRMRFHDLKEAPKGTAYILWAVSPDNQFQRLGQIVNVKGRNEAEIKSETAFDDFGLLLTTEDVGATTGTIIKPAGHRVAVITVIR